MAFKESITPEEIEAMDIVAFNGPISIISTRGKAFDDAIAHLSSCRMIGFDTETKPIFNNKTQRCGTALLQLSSETNSYLFRLHKLGLPQELADILASNSITKIGAAVLDDIRDLH